ncbi:unnamed protein product, partial [Musa hybrid cultivar]
MREALLPTLQLQVCYVSWTLRRGICDKMITRAPLPNTLNEFSDLVRTIFGQIYDLKYISRFCGGLRRGEIGLVGLSRLLNFEPVGIRHQAAYDSLLIGALFNEMKQRRHNVEDDRSASVLY